jgi:hypothetical protein
MVAFFLICCGEPPNNQPGNGSNIPNNNHVNFVRPGTSACAVIGPLGGRLSLADGNLTVPEGALTSETEICMIGTDKRAPDAFSSYTTVLSFEPAGLVFERPATLRVPYEGSSSSATIFWTVRGKDTFMALPTRVDGPFAEADVQHFSDGFVGSGCEGDDCCDPANGKLDLVLLVDNSNSMSEEQLALAEQLPRMARVLATGDLDGDGEQDFPALQSVRVGIIDPDMGSGGYPIMTCDEPILGDDGLFQRSGNPELEGCDRSYPRFAEYNDDEGPEALESFIEHVRCVAQMGIGGCGLEQQLEALLKAVTPSTSDIRFTGGSTGHADGSNAGFLRDDSIVAMVVVTDEGDCSVADTDLFDPNRWDLGSLNTRCYEQPDMLHSVDRYIDGLQAVRENPDDVIFSLVAGVPTDLVTSEEGTDYDAIFADERMEVRINPTAPNELLPSCASANGLAFTPRRMVEVAQGFGGNGVVQSICQEDFAPVIGSILDRVASRARGECVEE